MCIRKLINKIKYSVSKDNRIALVKLEGIIVDSAMMPVSSKFIEALDSVRRKNIKTVVIRVNSPGGTVGASQEIYTAIKNLKDDGANVIVSMGDVAASGGVYVAVAADKIVANPGTITGSVGVIIKSTVLKNLYRKLGIDHDIVKSGKYKDILSDLKKLSGDEQKVLQSMVDDTYNQFIETISEEREIDIKKVREFSDGRIFTGRQAKEIGLIDEIGSQADAINIAKDLAEIDEPDLIEIEPKKSFMQKISKLSIEQIFENISFGTAYSNIPLWIMKEF